MAQSFVAEAGLEKKKCSHVTMETAPKTMDDRTTVDAAPLWP